MLSQQQTQNFKSLLSKRAEQLRGEVQEVLARSSEESHANIAEQARDIEDDSFATLIVDTNLSEVERDTTELRLIDSALQRLSAGAYGICVDCGQQIPMARLEAEPTAGRCIRDQELYEKTHASGPTPSL